MRPRLVASDLDGTLLCSDGSVGARTASVWAALPEVGVESVLVTARPPRWLDGLSTLVGGHGVAICANGAFVYDVARGEVIESSGFTPAQACALIGDVLREHPGAGAAVETDRGMFRPSRYPDIHVGIEGHEGGVTDCELEDLPGDVVIGKILLRDPAWVEDGFVDGVRATIGARGHLAYSGAAGLAEISAPGVTKAARLARWCQEQGIDREAVWAFGDMPNDIPMLRWAGRGVAMEGAHPDLIAVADAVCGSNDDDGVARELARAIAPLREHLGQEA